ncbi:MAG: pentapeptide repeat-containing protein [Betaproteobacteria bacterium]|nr:pentapeptide repeat-containing protein [Betaproteobacteria bacterium]
MVTTDSNTTTVWIAALGASLLGASLLGASLGASLLGASLLGASLISASLIGASLISASLISASLISASLITAMLSGHLCVKISAAVRHSRNGRGAQSAQSAATDFLRALLPALIRFFCRGKNELVVHSGVRFSECSHVLNPWRCHWFGGMLWV